LRGVGSYREAGSILSIMRASRAELLCGVKLPPPENIYATIFPMLTQSSKKFFAGFFGASFYRGFLGFVK